MNMLSTMPAFALIDPTYVGASVAVFTGVILFLVIGLMLASRKLQPAGTIKININDGKKIIEVDPGVTLLSALSSQSVFLPSACGGGGTCAMCKCQVLEGGGSILPTETGHISKADAKNGMRLGCQVKVKADMKVHVHD